MRRVRRKTGAYSVQSDEDDEGNKGLDDGHDFEIEELPLPRILAPLRRLEMVYFYLLNHYLHYRYMISTDYADVSGRFQGKQICLIGENFFMAKTIYSPSL